MQRTRKDELDQAVTVINNLTGNAFKFEIQHAYGRPRLYRDGGSREVSPRLPRREMLDWLEAFIAGLEFASGPARPWTTSQPHYIEGTPSNRALRRSLNPYEAFACTLCDDGGIVGGCKGCGKGYSHGGEQS